MSVDVQDFDNSEEANLGGAGDLSVEAMIASDAPLLDFLSSPDILTDVRINEALAVHLGRAGFIKELIDATLRDFSAEEIEESEEIFSTVADVDEIPEVYRVPYLAAEILGGDLASIGAAISQSADLLEHLLRFLDAPHMNSWIALKLTDCLRCTLSRTPSALLGLMVDLQDKSFRETPEHPFVRRLVGGIGWTPLFDLLASLLSGLRDTGTASQQWWADQGVVRHLVDLVTGEHARSAGQDPHSDAEKESRVAGLRFFTGFLLKGNMGAFIGDVTSPEVTSAVVEAMLESQRVGGASDFFFTEAVGYLRTLLGKLPHLAVWRSAVESDQARASPTQGQQGADIEQGAAAAAAAGGDTSAQPADEQDESDDADEDEDDDDDDGSDEGITSRPARQTRSPPTPPPPQDGADAAGVPQAPPQCLLPSHAPQQGMSPSDIATALAAPIVACLPRLVEVLRDPVHADRASDSTSAPDGGANLAGAHPPDAALPEGSTAAVCTSGPLGLVRLAICEILGALAGARDAAISDAIISSGAVPVLFRLFEAYPSHSILHCMVLDVVSSALPAHLDGDYLLGDLPGSSAASASSSGPACPVSSSSFGVQALNRGNGMGDAGGGSTAVKSSDNIIADGAECDSSSSSSSSGGGGAAGGGADPASCDTSSSEAPPRRGSSVMHPFPTPRLLHHMLGECALPAVLLRCVYGGEAAVEGGAAGQASGAGAVCGGPVAGQSGSPRARGCPAFDAKGYSGIVLKLSRLLEQAGHDRAVSAVIDTQSCIGNVPGWREYVSTVLADKLADMAGDWRAEPDNEDGSSAGMVCDPEAALSNSRTAPMQQYGQFSALASRQGQGGMPESDNIDQETSDSDGPNRALRYELNSATASRVSRYHEAQEAERIRAGGDDNSDAPTEDDFAAAGFTNFGDFSGSDLAPDTLETLDAFQPSDNTAYTTATHTHPHHYAQPEQPVDPPQDTPSPAPVDSAPSATPVEAEAQQNLPADPQPSRASRYACTQQGETAEATPGDGGCVGLALEPAEGQQEMLGFTDLGVLDDAPTSPALATNVVGNGPNQYAQYCSSLKTTLLGELKELAGSFDSVEGMEGLQRSFDSFNSASAADISLLQSVATAVQEEGDECIFIGGAAGTAPGARAVSSPEGPVESQSPPVDDDEGTAESEECIFIPKDGAAGAAAQQPPASE